MDTKKLYWCETCGGPQQEEYLNWLFLRESSLNNSAWMASIYLDEQNYNKQNKNSS